MLDATTVYFITGAGAAAVFGTSYTMYILRKVFGKCRRARLQDWYYKELVTSGYKGKSRVQSAVRFYLVNRW